MARRVKFNMLPLLFLITCWIVSAVGVTVYLDLSGDRLVVERGPFTECEVAGDGDGVRRLLKQVHEEYAAATTVLAGRAEMRRAISRCQTLHANIYKADPAAFVLADEGDIFNEVMILERRDSVGGGKGHRHQRLPPPTGEQTAAYNTLRQNEQKNLISSIWSWNVFNRVLIMPGTKWCGQGDVAEHYNDLGYHSDVDKCCRNHDLCLTVTGEYLSPGECKKGLCNYSPFTRSPCHCDRQLSTCLRAVKTRLSNALGKMFFNIVGMTCYEYDHPVKHCAEYVEQPRNHLPPWILSAAQASPNPTGPRCRRYELDRTKPKAWQFFETVYDETATTTNQRSEMPRSSSSITFRQPRRHRKALSVFQRLMTDIFLSVVDPENKKKR